MWRVWLPVGERVDAGEQHPDPAGALVHEPREQLDGQPPRDAAEQLGGRGRPFLEHAHHRHDAIPPPPRHRPPRHQRRSHCPVPIGPCSPRAIEVGSGAPAMERCQTIRQAAIGEGGEWPRRTGEGTATNKWASRGGRAETSPVEEIFIIITFSTCPIAGIPVRILQLPKYHRNTELLARLPSFELLRTQSWLPAH
jgi:hypothetical protein